MSESSDSIDGAAGDDPHELCEEQPQKFAVKIIRTADEEFQRITLREYKLVSQLHHPNIIKMKEAYFN